MSRKSLFVLLILLTLCATFAPAAEKVTITHGPILGRLSSNGVGIWARTSKPGGFLVRFGLSPDKMYYASAKVQTSLHNDNTGWILIKDLRPGTKYYYRIESTDGYTNDNLKGSFKTLPIAAGYKGKHNPKGLFNLSFEFACGNSPQDTDPPRPTYVTMLRQIKDKIDFAILNGDWLYERDREFTVEQWLEQNKLTKKQTPDFLKLAPSVTGVWQNYKGYLEEDKNLAAWHRKVPSFFTFDDHEILGDINGAGEKGFVNKKAVFRDIGVKAWYDYLGWSNEPSFKQDIHFGIASFKKDSDILTDENANFTKIDLETAANLHVHWGGQNAGTRNFAATDNDENACVYDILEVLDSHRLRIDPPAKASKFSAYSIGRLSHSEMKVSNCHFFFLDTRSHRQLYDFDNFEKPGVSILGIKQRNWLMQKMKNSDADFFFVVSSVNLMIPHLSPNPKSKSTKSEAWTGFLHEREMLIDFWDSLGKPVFVLTGDLHNSFAIKITDRVWEFASGPHSSTNHSANAEAGRPPNGPYQFGPRACDIRWSSYLLPDIGRKTKMPHYCVVQINNVFKNIDAEENDVWIAYPKPHVVFQYYDGLTGDLKYAEPIFANTKQ